MPGLVLGYNELSTYASEKKPVRTNSDILPAELMFKLYDTYGLEESVIKQLANIQGYNVDIEGFRNLLNDVKVKSKQHASYEVENDQLLDCLNKLAVNGINSTDDTKKYEYTVVNDRYEIAPLECRVKAIIVNDLLVSQVEANTDCSIILDCTNFYHEAGGQDSDEGLLIARDGSQFQVSDLTNIKGYILHHGCISTAGKLIFL